jgi:long-chain acyl-CoA synthetase
MAFDSIVSRLKQHAQDQGNKVAMNWKGPHGWESLTWAQHHTQVRQFGGALLKLGYKPGETVAITGNNCPEWIIADLGAMYVRGVAGGIYQTSTPEGLQYVAHHMEAKVLVIEDKLQWDKVVQVRDQMPHVQRIVMIRDADQVTDDQVCSFAEFLATGADNDAAIDAAFEAIKADDLATLIYTSGTTGPPKGVMLTHDNLAWTAKLAVDLVGGAVPEDTIVCYLPLSHIAEQMFSILAATTAGYSIWTCPALDQLKAYLVEARPTLFLAVPRVWEKFKAALETKLGAATGAKAKVVRWSMRQGLKGGRTMMTTGDPQGLEALKYRVANKLFFHKLKTQLGLDRLKMAVTGAAPIGNDVLEFFLSCGIIIHEVYGQSEDTGPTTFNNPFPGQRKHGTVGLPLPGVEVVIAEDGEILVRGRNVFAGYFKDPEATAEALKDGWLYSGDVGEFDDQGFLKITDRKKDLIITAGGKNVAPQNIEKTMKAIDGIGQCVVIGDRRKFLSALFTLDPDGAPALAAKMGWPQDLESLANHSGFQSHLQAQVDQANSKLARYETIKKFTVLPQDFTIEGGELTPTMKVKRKVVNEKYASEIEAFYAGLG